MATELINAIPCPFCGGKDLRTVTWAGKSGEFNAIECNYCLAGAPICQWNIRTQPGPATGHRKSKRAKPGAGQ